MSKKVLFASRRPLGRCENITAIYEAYDGDKEFVQFAKHKDRRQQSVWLIGVR